MDNCHSVPLWFHRNGIALIGIPNDTPSYCMTHLSCYESLSSEQLSDMPAVCCNGFYLGAKKQARSEKLVQRLSDWN
jgi:hypothetical protein